MKLQAIPMYNYPIFLNLFVNILFIPICFAYIIPVARYGLFQNSITQEQMDMPKRPFLVMGALDCLATSLQVFACVFLPGPLIVLLPQAAIPLSLVLTRSMLKERYSWLQYIGAAIVLVGIAVAMEPVMTNRHAPHYKCEAFALEQDCILCAAESNRDDCLSHRTGYEVLLYSSANATDDETTPADALCQWVPFKEASRREELLTLIWSLVMIASCLPMTISTIYKEAAMVGEIETDPMFINGWVAIFQLFFNVIMAVPAGYFFSPAIKPWELLGNLWHGMKCYLGEPSTRTGCHPDTMCSFHAAFFVNMNLLTTVLYAVCMMYVIKYGNTSLLFLALTLMVPSKLLSVHLFLSYRDFLLDRLTCFSFQLATWLLRCLLCHKPRRCTILTLPVLL
jgi:drug/metabolite transporter (DMT)-like permease